MFRQHSYGSIVAAPDDDAQNESDVERSGGSSTRAPSKVETNGETESLLQDDDDDDHHHHHQRSATSSGGHEGVAQAGVKRLEAISSTWSKSALYAAYLGIALLAYATSLEGQTTNNLTIYATSAFKAHSLVSTVLVVQGVVLSVVKPPMSKIADVFGRFEAFGLAVVLYVIGYVQQAAADSVNTYAAAQVFYSAGQTGLQILIQIFVADTSDLVNRALCSTIPDLPYLANVWIGPAFAEYLLQNLSWRWGYGIWAIVLPLAFLPLALALVISQRKAAKRGLLPKSPFRGESWFHVAQTLWYELDFFGLVLISVAFALILIPLTLASKAGWANPNIASMLAIGTVCLFAVPFWERSKTLAPRAFFPRSFWQNKTLLAGLALSFFYFMAFYLSVYPYFQSYLLVVQGMTVTQAGRVVQTFTFTATVTSIAISFAIKHTKRYKTFMLVGTALYTLGLALMLLCRTQTASPVALVGTQVFLGLGGSLTHVPAQLGVQASARHAEVAAATALFLTCLEIGGAVGAAISGALWSARIPAKLAAYLPPDARDQVGEIFGNVSLAANGWPHGSSTRTAIERAYQETMTQILGVAVVASLPCIALALLMADYKLDEIDQGVRGVVIGGGTQRRRGSDHVSEREEEEEEEEEDDDMFGNSDGQPLTRTSLSRDEIGSEESRVGA